VVDVPGHERFIRNMLAGVHGIDLVLLTVSADDGVMPQTEEHVDILHLLGVRRGIVVITKADLADAARLAEVREEVEILTLDTTLEGAPSLAVSVVTGAGLDELKAEIARQLTGYTRAPRPGYFRLPVDRAFLIRGHGLVVTGTAVAGAIEIGATVRVLPGGEEARVRSIEVHGETQPRAAYGQRIALNLAGIEREDVGRQHVVCDARLGTATACIDAAVELRQGPGRQMRSHRRARVHLGTAEALATVVVLGGRDRLEPGERGYCQLRFAEPLMALGGDRFILRTETAAMTIGGGVVVNPFARRHSRREADVVDGLRALEQGGAPALRALLALEDAHAVTSDRLAQGLASTEVEVLALAREVGDVVPLPSAGAPEGFTLAARWDDLARAALDLVAGFHAEHPLAPGMELESLRTGLPSVPEPRVYRWLVDRLVGERRLVRNESTVRLPEHRVALDERARRVGARIEVALREAGLTPPDLRTLDVEGSSAKELADMLAVLEREGRVVRVAPDLYYAPDAVARGIALVREHCARHGEITAAVFRDLIGASRKYSIAFLDYLDRTGVTLRVGDVRRAR
jgi:selenocysteine-specific elongation factor